MNQQKIIVLAAGSDIGAYLTERYMLGGAEVVGTYRNWTPRVAELENAGAKLFPLVSLIRVPLLSLHNNHKYHL
jgi:hypothetical protein